MINTFERTLLATRQDKMAILGEILPIFRSLSAYFPHMVPHLPFLSPHVYGIRLFLSIYVYFPPIFCLKWYPILAINSSMEPICCFSAHMFTDSAYFLLIFHLTFCPYSAGPVLLGIPKLQSLLRVLSLLRHHSKSQLTNSTLPIDVWPGQDWSWVRCDGDIEVWQNKASAQLNLGKKTLA